MHIPAAVSLSGIQKERIGVLKELIPMGDSSGKEYWFVKLIINSNRKNPCKKTDNVVAPFNNVFKIKPFQYISLILVSVYIYRDMQH